MSGTLEYMGHSKSPANKKSPYITIDRVFIARAPMAGSRIMRCPASAVEARPSARLSPRWLFRARVLVKEQAEAGRSRQNLPRSRLRMARAGWLDVPWR